MTTSSSTSMNVPKITMLKAKTGFIIPKNKISSSLVPAYKGVKKADGSDGAHEESAKPLQRKTKWGPDLTQDSTVRKGRALAYQTRVDQITQLLESGTLATRKEKSSTSGGNAAEHEKQLELEKQEAIGELIKINPTYKVPSDYKPLTREATVPLPLTEDVGYNFVRLVFGPSDTQKRVQKETGALIRVYGTKLEDEKKIEVSASGGSENLTSYHDLHVLVSADSYEKVDAAVALIELILSSVSGKSTPDGPSVQGDDTITVSKSQDATSDLIANAAMRYQGSEQSVMGSVTNPHGNIQPSSLLWPQNGGPFTGSGSVLSPNSMPNVSNPISVSPLPFYPSNMPSLFAPRPGHSPAFGSPPLNSNMIPPRPQPPSSQAFPNNFTSMQHHPSGQSNTPSNLSASPFSGHQAPAFSPHQPGPSPGSSTLLPPRQFHGPVSMPSQTQSSASMLVQHFGQVPASPSNNSLGGSPIPRPVPPAFRPMQPSMPGPGPGGIPAPSFTPVRSIGGPTPGAQHTNAGDFTYQPHKPDMFPRPGLRPGISGMQHPPAPPSFRPAMQAPPPLRPPMGNQMGMQLLPPNLMNPNQIPPSNMNPHMGMGRDHNPFAPSGGPFLNQPTSFQQGPPFARPGNPFPPNQGFRSNLHGPGRPNFGTGGGYQVYDPFSPTSVHAVPAKQQGGNSGNARRQENDPEYEDLMASVGVK